MSIRPTVLLPQCEMATVCPSGDVVIIFGSGAIRMSAAELREVVDRTGTQIREVCGKLQKGKNLPFEKLAELLEEANK